ncbi:MAG: hypothetical protein ACE5FD_02525 [Anaerolineae bacterium]
MNKNLVSSMLGYGVILISLFLLAACRPTEKVALAAPLSREAGTVYAMDAVDLKLFNAAETSPANVTAVVHPADRKFFTDNYLGSKGTEAAVAAGLPKAAGTVYAMDAVDLKLFNAAETSPANVTAVVHPADRKFFTDDYLGSLARDNFDYEQAAENMAFRWQAMAAGYEKAGLLNDSMDAGDVKAFRWLAIARGYENLGLLNNK